MHVQELPKPWPQITWRTPEKIFAEASARVVALVPEDVTATQAPLRVPTPGQKTSILAEISVNGWGISSRTTRHFLAGVSTRRESLAAVEEERVFLNATSKKSKGSWTTKELAVRPDRQ